MTDIALVVMQDISTNRFKLDWAMDGPDLEVDDGLFTPIALSLFTWRIAAPDDKLPADDQDPKGFWGDVPPDGGKSDPVGSRLWLLVGAPHTSDTARRAILYAREALAWLISDGVVQSFDVTAEWIGTDTLGLSIVAKQRSQQGQQSLTFSFQWDMTFFSGNDFVVVGPATPLRTEAGDLIQAENSIPLTEEQ